MPQNKGPWKQAEDAGSRFPLGVVVWLGLFVFIGILIGTLFIIFPDQASSEDTYLEIARTVGFLVLVSSGLIYARRIKFGEAVRNAAIWIGITSVLILGYTYRTDLSDIIYRVAGELVPGLAVPLNSNEIVITASQDGHFYVNGEANGKRLRFMVDTGASDITLSRQAAVQIGIDLKSLQFTKQYRTANGIVYGAPYALEKFSIGPFEFEGIKVSINQAEMSESLLGMSFLGRLQSFESRGSKLYLRR